MTKKIIDIVPPSEGVTGSGEEIAVRRKGKREKKNFEEKPSLRAPRSPSRFPTKVVVIVVGLVVVLGAAAFFGFRPQLTLYIIPLQETIKIEEEIKVDISQGALDIEAQVVPGRIFETEEEKWDIFQSTGSEFEGEKAEGTILVYNAHSPPSPVRLREQTRFLSSTDGKIFRASEKIYLPPAAIRGGKVIPNVTEVKVVAQEIGEDYNIGPSKFSVPGLSGTALYYTIWAESEKAIAGGSKTQVKKVTPEDLETAKAALEKGLKELAKSSLENKLPDGFVLKEGAIFEQNFKISCLQEAGSRVSEFNCQGEIRAEGLAFRAADLQELAHHFIRTNIPSLKKLVPRSLNLSFSPKGAITQGGKMVLSLTIGGKTYEELNQDAFLSQIKAKTQEAIEELIFKDYSQIENVKFKFWPFWIKKAPKNPERIKVELTF